MNKRRDFLQQSSALTIGFSLLPNFAWEIEDEKIAGAQDQVLKKLVKINDSRIESLLEGQIDQPNDRWHGGIKNGDELPNAHSTNSFIVVLASSYVCMFSEYYKSKRLEKPLDLAISCLLNVQYEDGTIDLYSTNFHSTPDTAFLVNYLSPVYACVKRMQEPGMNAFIAKLGEFFIKAGLCLQVGGIHTPNHRWVVCSALARLYSFFPEVKYITRIDEWLSEGVDQDPDGQYHERSVSVYSPVCNDMFLTIGKLLNRPELLEIVRKNLAMSLYYIQPGGEVVTDASNRQDRAMTGYVSRYYYGYKYFAIKDKNPEFEAVCQLLEQTLTERIVNNILELIEDPIFNSTVVTSSKIPDNYFKRFAHSGVFRIRRGDLDITVVEKNPSFFSIRKGTAIMQSMRFGAAFFGKGQFEAEESQLEGEKIILKRSLTKGYYQVVPIEERKGENAWVSYDREKRDLSEAQTMDYNVQIQETGGTVKLFIEMNGTPHVPVALEMSFKSGGELSGVIPDKNIKDLFFLEEGKGYYQFGKDKISFEGGSAPHKWSQIRGMLPKQDGLSVYITGYTPFKHVITLQ